MKIEWSNLSKQDLQDFLHHTHIQNDIHLTKYISNLINYVDHLATFHYLGKILFYINNIEIRQLLYRKHRIIYYLEPDRIIILSVIHTHRDINNYIKFLKKNRINLKN